MPFTEAWWSPPFFYPLRETLALSEHLAGIAVFTTPLQLAGVQPLGAYNIAFILSGCLSGYFAFLLGRRVTGSAFAGLVAGIAFALAPYRASQLSHLQVLTSQWMPLALFAMHRWLDDGRARWLVLFAAAWLIQALSNGYYLLFFPVLIGMWLLWFVDWKRNRRRGTALAATFLGSSALLVPSLMRYQEVHRALGLQRTAVEMRGFSAAPASFIEPYELLKFWPSRPTETPEAFLFPGVTAVLLAVAGAVALAHRRQFAAALRDRSAGLFYGLAAIACWWLCFGPAPQHSALAWIQYPYTALTLLPGYGGLRVPARFGMLAALCLSIAAAVACVRLAPARPLARVTAAVLIVAGLFVDGWIDAVPLSAPPGRAFLHAPADSLVIELPVSDDAVSTSAMYRAIIHRRPLVNGYSGHVPPHYALFGWSLAHGDPTVLDHFARGRPLVVVVHRIQDPKGDLRRMVEDAGGVLQEETGVGPVFVISPQPQLRLPSAGAKLPSMLLENGQTTALDLGSTQRIGGITIPLRRHYEELTSRLTIQTSDDGAAWTTAWEGWIGEAALIAALDNPTIVPMTLFLPDARARYLRVAGAPPWVMQELTIFAPN